MCLDGNSAMKFIFRWVPSHLYMSLFRGCVGGCAFKKILKLKSAGTKIIKVIGFDEYTPKTYFLKPQFQKTAHWCPKNQKPTPKFGQKKKSELTGV